MFDRWCDDDHHDQDDDGDYDDVDDDYSICPHKNGKIHISHQVNVKSIDDRRRMTVCATDLAVEHRIKPKIIG